MSPSKSDHEESELAQSVSAIGQLAWPKITNKDVASDLRSRDLESSISTARRRRDSVMPAGWEERESLADLLQHVLERRLAALVELERAIGALRKRRR
jgi:hypothetical protein